MTIRIEYQFSGLDRARAAVRYLQNLGESPRALMEIAGQVLEDSTRSRFDRGRGPGGLPWPVSKRQVHAARPGGRGKRRSKMGPNRGGKTLVDTGKLVSSIRHEARNREVEVGVSGPGRSVKHAYVHQFGATIVPKRAPFLIFTAPDGSKVFAKKVEIPARPFLGIDAQDRDDILDAWFDLIRAKLGTAR